MNGEHISFELLSRYQDGDFFPASEKSRIEEHLKICPHCRAELMKIEKMVSMVAALSSYGISPSMRFQERAMAGIVGKTRSYEGGFFKKHYLPASAVAAIVVAVIGFSIFTTETLHNVSSRMEASRSEHRGASESGPVIEAMQAVRSAGGTVVEVSDTYIMVEAPVASVARIRQSLPRCPVQVYGYLSNDNALAVSSGGTGVLQGPAMVKMKITVK